jgi:hypothetical protein
MGTIAPVSPSPSRGIGGTRAAGVRGGSITWEKAAAPMRSAKSVNVTRFMCSRRAVYPFLIAPEAMKRERYVSGEVRAIRRVMLPM